MSAGVEPYPPIEPYETGMLEVGDGQSIYWEASGNPGGKPAVALHGGPGGELSAGRRRWFDPDRYRLIQLDQRGCGRSRPHAGRFETDLATNTTPHLIADLEQLREHLGIDRWLVWGASWGVTLGLAYAERHPERVTEMILLSITLTRPSDVHWLGRTVGRFFPEEWAAFRAGVPEAERDGDLVAAYDRLINDGHDPQVRLRAVRDWVTWEDAILSLEEGYVSPHPRWADDAYRIAFARLVTHYFAHAAWLEEDELLVNAGRLAGIPGILLHGRLDLAGPPDVAWQLAEAWSGSELHFVSGGHRGDAEMDRLLLDATDRFAGQP
ncbi:MAG: prolyl aminopeptidase [Candidatus Limnocylindrales bacterium]